MKDIEVHACTEAELGLTEDSNSKFFKFPPDELKSIEKYVEHYYCLDHSEVEIMNEIDDYEFSNLQLDFSIPEALCQNKESDKLDISCDPGV